jgi:hypothetical protein
VESLTSPRQRNRLHRILTLGGYVEFNVPRAVTLAGGSLLGGVAATHVYLLAAAPAPPAYFAVYCTALIIGCLLAAGVMWLNVSPQVPQLGWFLGSTVCLAFLVVYLASRASSLPGLIALTGRWDFAPGTLALACAGAFIGLHASVLLGINVAFGQHRGWHD